MQKTDVNTVLTIFFVATAVMLIGGLAVIPAFEEVEAVCKDKDKVKDKVPKNMHMTFTFGSNFSFFF
jgi:hypothetical protein